MDVKSNDAHMATGCGPNATIVPSKNPLIPNICIEKVKGLLDYNSVEDADFFCRIYNFPFEPTIWINMAKEYQDRVFEEYTKLYNDDEYNEDEYENWNKDLWKDLNEEWGLVQTHEHLISKIKPIKEGFMLRNHIKWGSNYTFEELITLENLFVNTLSANDVSNPMQIDAIKKACKMSVALDRAIVDGDAREINDLSKAYQSFIKTAKIDDLITASSQDVISNVAQLVEYIEKEGFEFTFYDDVERDIVDKSLKDIQQFLQRLVMDATGLDSVFETISNAVKEEDAVKKDSESFERVPLEDLYQNAVIGQSEEFDAELEAEEILFDEDEEDDFF